MCHRSRRCPRHRRHRWLREPARSVAEKSCRRVGPDGGDGRRGRQRVRQSRPQPLDAPRLPLSATHWRAERGQHGKGNRTMCGKSGRGTSIFRGRRAPSRDADTGEVLGEMIHPDQVLLVAKGRSSGRGISISRRADAPSRRASGSRRRRRKERRLELVLKAHR